MYKFSKMKKIQLVGNLFLYYKYNKTTMEKNKCLNHKDTIKLKMTKSLV